jgi:hypothetical protein
MPDALPDDEAGGRRTRFRPPYVYESSRSKSAVSRNGHRLLPMQRRLRNFNSPDMRRLGEEE